MADALAHRPRVPVPVRLGVGADGAGGGGRGGRRPGAVARRSVRRRVRNLLHYQLNLEVGAVMFVLLVLVGVVQLPLVQGQLVRLQVRTVR